MLEAELDADCPRCHRDQRIRHRARTRDCRARSGGCAGASPRQHRRKQRPRRSPGRPLAEAAAAAPAAEEFDHEIANIYSEEATELIEAAEVSLTAWNRDRKDKQRVAELQRQLHTLKGGARMAGISAMGDLSHELETLVMQIDGGWVAGDDHAHAVMQASLDELARMRDLVSTGTLPGGARGADRTNSRVGDTGANSRGAPRPRHRRPP